MDIKQICSAEHEEDAEDLIRLAQVTDKWWGASNKVMNFPMP
jgi:hypothetical protein